VTISRSAILNFQRDLVVVWFIHLKLLISLLNTVQKIEYLYKSVAYSFKKCALS